MNLIYSTVKRHPIVIIAVLFFIFGSVSWFNSILIPYLKIACELNNMESYLVASAFYLSYFLLAIPSSFILKKTGFKKGMVLGLTVIAVGASVFIPAALTREYPVFLLGLFIQGGGLTLLQTASNPYVTLLGPVESAARRISIMGVCNKVAGAISPLILGFFILSGADTLVENIGMMDAAEKTRQLDALARLVIVPYIVIACVLLLLAAFVYKSTLPEIDKEQNKEEVQENADRNQKAGSIFQFPHLLLGVFALFLYVGVEKIAGYTVVSYGQFHGITLSTSKFFTSLLLLAMIAGYFLGILLIPRYLSQSRALLICALSGVAFTLAAMVTAGAASVLFVCLLGLSNSLIWPTIWPLAIAGLGQFTKLGSSFLILAISGGALLPLAYGWLADHADARLAYVILIPCYLFIGYYAVRGHTLKPRN